MKLSNYIKYVHGFVDRITRSCCWKKRLNKSSPFLNLEPVKLKYFKSKLKQVLRQESKNPSVRTYSRTSGCDHLNSPRRPVFQNTKSFQDNHYIKNLL